MLARGHLPDRAAPLTWPHRVQLSDQRVPEQSDIAAAIGVQLTLQRQRHGQPHTITAHGGGNQGQLVHNNPPPVSALANRHGDRRPRRNDAARPQRPIASTAPPSPQPAGRPVATSGSSTNAQRTKCWRITSAKHRARRSQPRTVDSGSPSSAAIGLNPTPSTAINSARPITSTASRRRHKHTHGNNTCHAPQPRHRARRGRNHTSSGGTPPATRTGRQRA